MASENEPAHSHKELRNTDRSLFVKQASSALQMLLVLAGCGFVDMYHSDFLPWPVRLYLGPGQ